MEEKFKNELINTGLTFVANTLTQIISNVNAKRLEEKRVRKLKEQKNQTIKKVFSLKNQRCLREILF